MKDFCAGVHKTIMARYLFCHSQTQTGLPVWLPVPQGNGYTHSTYHTGVQSRDHDCDQTVNPDKHVRNGFLHFLCHESTKICQYYQGLISKNDINRDNKLIKMFPLLMAILTMLVFILFYHQDRSIPIGSFLWVFQSPPHHYDSSYGLSMNLP